MYIVIAIIVLAFVVYYVLKSSDEPTSTAKPKQEAPKPNKEVPEIVVPIKVGIQAGRYEPDDAFTVTNHLLSIYRITTGYYSYYRGGAALEAITKELLGLKEYIDKEHVFKSKHYDAIIAEYNQVANDYKMGKERLVEDSMAVFTAPDMQHCPSCLEDIGREVTRARMCPKCKERIIIFRNIPDMRFLVNQEQEKKLVEMWTSIHEFHVPNLLDAFDYSEEVMVELIQRINEMKEEEKLIKKAKNLTIDF